MKVIAAVQSKRASSRGLVHYIANSKIDPAREASGRELFTEHSDKVSVEKINNFLTKGVSKKRPTNDDLHHLVISFKTEDFERLGSDEKERQKSLKEITRHAMKQFEKEVGADKLAWAAGIHLNTDNPHVHIAITKEYFDKNLEKKSLNKIPTSLLPHYEKTGEEKTFAPGSLIEAASQKLDEIQLEQQHLKQNLQSATRQNQTPVKTQSKSNSNLKEQDSSEARLKADMSRQRDILAKAVLAKYYLDKTKENLESLAGHGDKRRFTIHDRISGKKRSISLFDLERRAEISANRKIKNLKITDALKKDELKKNLVQIELRKNADGIKRIKTILHNLVVKETRELRKREEDYKTVKPLAEKIKQNCRRENKKLPVPDLTPDELEMLQTKALEKKEFRAANYFERVRVELARERKSPTRTNLEVQKLNARQTISALRVSRQEKQLKTFSENMRHFPVEIEGKKQTLSQIDALFENRAFADQKFTGKISKVLGKIGLNKRKSELAQLAETGNQIAQKIKEKHENFANEITREKALLKTLENFYEKDTNPEKEKLEPKFSAKELAEIEALAFELKLPEVYRENWSLQKQLIEGSENKEKLIPETKQQIIAGRALARQVLSEIELARCKEELHNFKKHRDFTKFEVINKKTGEEKFVSLSEVRFDSRGSLFDQTLEYFLENREKRDTRRQLEKIVKEKQFDLKTNLRDAKTISKIASEEARDFQTRSIFGTVKFLHAPVFTPQELMTIELRINQTTVRSEAKNLQKILDAADHSKAKNLSAILSGSMTETKELKQNHLPSINENVSKTPKINQESQSLDLDKIR